MTQDRIIKKPINVAIAGLGFGEAVHLPALKTLPFFNPLAVWHPREERLQQVCDQYSLTGYTEWASLLNESSIEAIVIATPPAPRFKLAREALLAGKHLLLEKPIALKAEEIEELQRLAILKNISVAVDFEYRAVPLFMQAKRILENDFIGKPWLIKLDWLMSSRANKSKPWNWYSNSKEGGGVVGALGTHAFDILHWLCGPTQNLNSITSTSIKERVDPKTKKTKIVSSEDIAISNLEVNYLETNSLVPTQVTLSSVAVEGRGFSLEIYGSEGTLILRSENQKDYVHGFGLWTTSIGEKKRTLTPDLDLAFQTTWTDGRIAPVARLQSWWAESIHNGSPMIPGLSEGLMSQKACETLIDGNQIEN